jgi:uncharacterized protein YbjT (DUF2867 family)
VTVLVAGGTGVVGEAAVRRLRRDDADVSVMTAHPDRSLRRIKEMGATAVLGDVRYPETLDRAVAGAEVVVQALMFPTYPTEKPRRGYTFEEFDHRGTERLVAAARSAGVRRYVFVSAVGAAPDADQVWYRAKWGGEQAVIASGLEHCIVRPSWVFGPKDRALNRFAAIAKRSPVVPVIGDGQQRLQPLFVEDLADVLAMAARPGGPTGTYEMGGPTVMTMDEVLTTMLVVMGKQRPLVHFPEVLTKAAGAVWRLLPKPLLSPQAVDFLTADAIADNRALLEAFEVRLTPLAVGLSTYLGR